MWTWLEGLDGGAAAFVGSLTGLVVILLGALFNAHLNRRRDDRLRSLERSTVIAALQAELTAIKEALQANAVKLDQEVTAEEAFLVPDIALGLILMPHLTAKVGLVGDLAIIRSVLKAYAVVPQVTERLIFMGGQLVTSPQDRIVLRMDGKLRVVVARLFENTAAMIDDAILKLNSVG